MSHYINPRGLYDFQARLVAYGCLRLGNLVVADQGLGKSHVAMATMAMLFEDNKIDVVVLICEHNKLGEWHDDLRQFTNFRQAMYYGPKRAIDPNAQVIMSTYATWSGDLVDVDPDDPKTCFATELLDRFIGRRVFVVYDEMALLGTARTSLQYRANEMAVSRWRERAETRVMGLTGTPMSTSPECFFNLGVIIKPEAMGTLGEFMRNHVTRINRYGRPDRFRDLEGLERELSTFMVRKRKTDPDVIDQFPAMSEKFVYLNMSPAHMKAYRSLEDHLATLPEAKLVPSFQLMNAFVCHPRSILRTQWEAAQDWIEAYGVDKINKLDAIKAKSVIGYVGSIVRAEQTGVICFNNSVSALEALANDIEHLPSTERFDFVRFHGQRSDKQNTDAKAAFKAGSVRVMLASSKAERGINLGEATYVVNFGIPTTHSSYLQRAGRASRIGTNVGGIVTVKSFVSRGTIEEATTRLWNRRNEWSDRLQDVDAPDDGSFVTAFMRRCMLKIANQQTDDGEAA